MSPFKQSGYNISNYFFRFCLLEEFLILLARIPHGKTLTLCIYYHMTIHYHVSIHWVIANQRAVLTSRDSQQPIRDRAPTWRRMGVYFTLYILLISFTDTLDQLGFLIMLQDVVLYLMRHQVQFSLRHGYSYQSLKVVLHLSLMLHL